ncbi:hypothetical protein UA38_04880 [Photobacterium kishitanii]|uniref:Phage protein n=1 Tax=Photobacterium kishitanii TaxID=318456 RepID=A0AAX0YYG1_9GAMM|nr:hypothetical protein [Photobacterium kishitanii]KJG11626.1 hypothetical protein UB40_03185 [Photobacterium kishitanii]KJG59065.1 hypothetical protein UA38_04880 [Photobacterium kishitanii]KJG62010.1 hypothetical protein UA42_06255 [Photobacterium kishitanii]KJG67255.1 hypothetical protein UA40_04890 [Photobacterium kishitanii]KJG70500.1 hypothetical protein UA41_04520 [Photobacterium kishitanii]
MITINFRLPHGNTENFEQKFVAYTKAGAFLQDEDGENKVIIPAYNVLSVTLKYGDLNTQLKKDLKSAEPTKIEDYKDSTKLMEALLKTNKEE